MISRYLGGRAGLAAVSLTATLLVSTAAWADGPGYTYIGASYEWTDVKYAVNPSEDPNFNTGSIQGANIDASLGILGWLHVAGQYFTGDCDSCGTRVVNNQFVPVDTDFTGYKVGLGLNIGLDKIGLNDYTDFVLRGNFVDTELKDPGVSKLTGDGWSVEGLIRSQISDRAELMVGFEYTDLGDVKNSDLIVGLGYQVGLGITLTADAIIFDNDTGFALGLRWYFGNLLFGNRDSIVR